MVALFEPPTFTPCRGRKRDGSRCEGRVRFANTCMCEDCWAMQQRRLSGRSQRARLERVNYEDDES